MAVLAEAISLVIRADALLARFNDDWEAFKGTVPNATLCADGELVRVGFMAPDDVKAYVAELQAQGLRYVVDGKAQDMVVVDQQRGPMVACDWIEFGQIDLDNDPKKPVAACRLVGSTVPMLVRPDGWQYEGSLSQTFTFMPTGFVSRTLRFLGLEGGVERHRSRLTGKDVFIGRTRKGD